jgi:hypothetical protein
MNVKVNNLKRTDSSVVRLWVQHFCCFVFFCFFVFNHCCSDKGGIYKQDINIEVKHPVSTMQNISTDFTKMEFWNLKQELRKR